MCGRYPSTINHGWDASMSLDAIALCRVIQPLGFWARHDAHFSLSGHSISSVRPSFCHCRLKHTRPLELPSGVAGLRMVRPHSPEPRSAVRTACPRSVKFQETCPDLDLMEHSVCACKTILNSKTQCMTQRKQKWCLGLLWLAEYPRTWICCLNLYRWS